MERVYNFNPGPAALPLEVLEKAREELLNFRGSGMSVMETSHRSKEFEAVHNEAQEKIKKLIGAGDDFKVLFLQGGASLQFAMVPMNYLDKDRSADYIITGSWSEKALKEAKRFGKINIAGTTEQEKKYTRIPKQAELKLDAKAVYVHITSNNTIFGTQWASFPITGNVPLVADMSSDFLSRKFDPKPFGLIYAGAQKNLGPAGVTVVLIRNDFLAKANQDLPSMLTYHTYAKENSLYNTPPCLGIYMVNLFMDWILNNGGIEGMEKRNQEKGTLLYGVIDNHASFYKCPVEKDSRSLMNVVFRLPSEQLEDDFVKQGKSAGFVGLKGHRSVGGIRISMYNAIGPEVIKELVRYMEDFAKKNG